MQSDNFRQIKTAIENKWIVYGIYGGRERVMCPHALGFGGAGEEKALFYQFDGESSSGGLPEWRCLTLSGLEITKVASGDWHTGARHTRPQTCVKRVIAEWRGDQA